MRVAYICADAGIPVFGTKGCSVHVQEIIKQFLNRDDRVNLFAVRAGGVNNLRSPRLACEEVLVAPASSTSMREINQIRAAEHVALELMTSEFDLVYERYSLWSCQSLNRAQSLDIPSVLEVNAPLIEEQLQHRDLFHIEKARAIRDSAFLAATSIVAVSDEVAKYVRTHLPSQHHAKVHVVPNGVDTERFRPDVAPLMPNSQFTIGFVGTLKPWHGLESLIAAFHSVHQRHPEIRLRIIGDGPLRGALQDQVDQYSPALNSAIQWIGAVQPHDVPGHLTALDVAIAPYLESDNFYFSPLKIYEYMAAGNAVVASSIGQIRAVIDHGRTGLLYAPGHVEQLASAICQLANQPILARQLGLAARKQAIESHSWRRTLDLILGYVQFDFENRRRFQASAELTEHLFSGGKPQASEVTR